MKNKSIKISALLLSFLFIVAPMFVFAQIKDPLQGGTDIGGFITWALGYVVKIGGIISIFAFIWSGFLFVKAQGSEKGITDAKNFFYGTCIGVAVLLGAQLISSIIVNTIGSLGSSK